MSGFPDFTISWSLLELVSIQPMMPANHLSLCLPLLLLPSVFASIRVFSNELTLHIRRPKHWKFSFILRVHHARWQESRVAGTQKFCASAFTRA